MYKLYNFSLTNSLTNSSLTLSAGNSKSVTNADQDQTKISIIRSYIEEEGSAIEHYRHS